eukprot:TRINITY_DN3185_c0_g1_i4.p1 TRINITY_DN3185_c0_g1~~TRINITY_DN3185_c0_g1_i4.p1  ORF type:complete len:316 (-),score=89.29 TRINITY_DN3185_c0_g1_i4:39-986(-)
MREWAALSSGFLNTPLVTVEASELTKQLTHYTRAAYRIERGLGPSGPLIKGVSYLQDVLGQFKELAGVVSGLRSPHIRPRHWDKIQEALGQRVARDAHLTLRVLDAMGAVLVKDALADIVQIATNEAAVDETLRKLQRPGDDEDGGAAVQEVIPEVITLTPSLAASAASFVSPASTLSSLSSPPTSSSSPPSSRREVDALPSPPVAAPSSGAQPEDPLHSLVSRSSKKSKSKEAPAVPLPGDRSISPKPSKPAAKTPAKAKASAKAPAVHEAPKAQVSAKGSVSVQPQVAPAFPPAMIYAMILVPIVAIILYISL